MEMPNHFILSQLAFENLLGACRDIMASTAFLLSNFAYPPIWRTMLTSMQGSVSFPDESDCYILGTCLLAESHGLPVTFSSFWPSLDMLFHRNATEQGVVWFSRAIVIQRWKEICEFAFTWSKVKFIPFEGTSYWRSPALNSLKRAFTDRSLAVLHGQPLQTARSRYKEKRMRPTQVKKWFFTSQLP